MKKYAVIGDPIEHSLSPMIHNFVFSELGLPYEYVSYRVIKGELDDFIRRLADREIAAFNATMPHKVDIMNFLDKIDKQAELYNSVNTVVLKNGDLCGYSTDALGFSLSLADAGMTMEGKNILILGAGGVVNTLIIKAGEDGAENITILNRSIKNALNAKEKAAQRIKVNVTADVFSSSSIEKNAAEADIIINATPLGMSGVAQDFENLDFISKINPNGLVCDLIYNPPTTKMLEKAKNANLKTVNGLGMLIYQGLLADKLFFDIEFDIAKMKKKVENHIKHSL